MCVYIYICIDCYFFAEEGYLLNLLKVSLVICLTLQAKYILAIPTVCMTNESTVIDIAHYVPSCKQSSVAMSPEEMNVNF